jgi:hypothetical protein
MVYAALLVLISGQFILSVSLLARWRDARLWQAMAGNLLLLMAVFVVLGSLLMTHSEFQRAAEAWRQRGETIDMLMRERARMVVECR